MRNRGGFTIVETLVVLGVASIIFVAVIGSIVDRQNRIQFSQGMRDINSNISDVLNDVTTGFFPTTSGMTCLADSNNAAPQLGYDASTGDTTGARKDCVFAGKVIQIGTDTSASSGFVYSMVGRRLTYNGANLSDVANFSELKPVVVDSKNTDNITAPIPADISNIDATTGLNLPYGIRIVRSDGSDGGRAIGVFYKDFRGVSLNGQASSGVTLVAVADVWSATSGPSTQANVIAAADNTAALASRFLSGSSTLTLCFKSGTTNQTATITIGDGIQGSLKLDYDVDLSGVLCV